jgi:glycosyltransferase involved in cell wall biosynthesis
MITILIIHQSAELYGSDKTLLLLLKHIDKTKFYPVVVLPNEGILKDELEKENIEVVIAPVLKLSRKMFTPKNIFKFIKDIKKGISILDKLNKKHHFDIVYSNTLAVSLGMVYAKKRKIKHLWHVHEIIIRPKIIAAIYPKLLMIFSDLVVCNSIATQKNLTQRIPKLESKSIVIYNGIEIPKGSNPDKINLGFPVDNIVISLVGRISSWKGQQLLVSAFVILAKKHLNIKLVFLGSAPLNQEHFEISLKNKIAENKLHEHVVIFPFQKEIAKFWNSIDIAVVPSTEPEPFGLVATEAMLAKKPVIASNHGGLAEIVIDDVTGFLVAPNDAIALAEAISKLIDNPELRTQFGKKGHERVINEFSIERHVDQFEAIFENFQNNF